MDKLEEFQKAAVERLKNFSEYVKIHWKAFLIGALALVLVFLLTVVVIPNAQKNIRIKEVEALVEKDVEGIEQVSVIPYDGLETVIRKENKLALALVDPNDENYPSLIKALNDKGKMSQYQDKLFFYPVVYNQKELKKFYKLGAGITLIYFENQVETDRTELVEQKEIELYLVDHLNSLSRGKVVKEEQEGEETTDSTTESTTESEDEEPIDELKGLGESPDDETE